MKILPFVVTFLILFFHSVDLSAKTIHVIVALCDNENQGIVPVPQKLGDGSSPNTNLYWGAMYGVKSFFKRSKDWNLIAEKNHISDRVVERIIFKHIAYQTFIVADAYYGHFIKSAIYDFIDAARGSFMDSTQITYKSKKIKINLFARSDLLAYVGHDGLMEFDYTSDKERIINKINDIVVLACDSKYFFKQYLDSTSVNPLLWTTGLMAPEAYTLHAVIEGWINKESKKQIEERAAFAYNKYQNCGLKAAFRLFDNRW